MKGGIDGYRLADSSITVVHRKSNATATFMGTAERLLDIHGTHIPILRKMNKDVIVLLCPTCKTRRFEEAKGLSPNVLKSQRRRMQMIRCHNKER